jgi:hypothetical protein
VESAKKSDPKYLDFVGDFINFDKATKIDIADLEKKLKDFQEG